MRLVAVPLIAAAALFGQTTPTFEVVSVKHTQRGPIVLRAGEITTLSVRPVQRSGNRLTVHQTLHGILNWAYSIQNSWQVAGPHWLDSDFYEVEAVLPPETSLADSRLMMRAMLADRFGLKAHTESREFAIYALLVAKGGPKLEEIPQPERHGYGFKPGGSPGTTRFEANPGMQLSSLAASLRSAAGRPVVDETGLSGFYKVQLEWSHEPGENATAGILSALSRLGLKVEPKKATFDVVVVDAVNNDPTPN